MNNTIPNEYKIAFFEVSQILSTLPMEDFNKIPKEKIALIENNKIDNGWKYDKNKDLNEQNTSELTKVIISIFFKNYWATDKQKREIKIFDENQIRKAEIEKGHYNAEDIFKNRSSVDKLMVSNKANEKNIENENSTSVEYKKPKWYKKIFAKLFKIFKKKSI